MSSAWWCAHLLTRTDLLTRPNLLIGGKCHRILLVWPFGKGPNQTFIAMYIPSLRTPALVVSKLVWHEPICNENQRIDGFVLVDVLKRNLS